MPQAMPYMLSALDFSLDEPKRAVVAGANTKPETQALLRAIQAVYQPNKVVLGTDGPVEPFAHTLAQKDGVVVYLCTGSACQAPTGEIEKLKQLVR